MKKIIVMLAVLLFVSAWTIQAQSAGKPQFVFKGSFDLTSLQKSTKTVQVSCKLLAGTQIVGNGYSKVFAVGQDGTVLGNYIVNANVKSGKDPYDVTNYHCYISHNDGKMWVAASITEAKKGTTPITKYTGTFNPPSKTPGTL